MIGAGDAAAGRTPSQVPAAQALQRLKQGNLRFRSGRTLRRDWPAEVEKTRGGQAPFAEGRAPRPLDQAVGAAPG